MLTTIVSQDPMYVVFPVSQREFLEREAQRGQRRATAGGHAVRVLRRLVYDKPGVIDFVDVQVDRATDTVLVRATIPNPGGALIDGQLVRVAVRGDKPEEQVLVPQAALLADQQGTYRFRRRRTARRQSGGSRSAASKGADAVIDGGLVAAASR